MRLRLPLAWSVLACISTACEPPVLSLGTARVAGGPEWQSAAATWGDDYLQLMVGDCSELIAFRNFPSWQFDSCESCFGKAPGEGIISSRSAICGHARGPGWASDGECGAELTTELSTADELRGTLTVSRVAHAPLTVTFRAARIALLEAPASTAAQSLCEAAGFAAAVCCNWRRDEACGETRLSAACRD